MSLNSELQELLIKMGGEALESDSNVDLMKKIVATYIDIPEIPEEDGTYVLQATVADGEVELAWITAQAEITEPTT